MLSSECCEQARLARDPRFDGLFFTAVKTTGIYCRSICPAGPAKAENVTFYFSDVAARRDGFRPCLRCKPEQAPVVEPPTEYGALRSVMRLIRRGEVLDSSTLERCLRIEWAELERLSHLHYGSSLADVADSWRRSIAGRISQAEPAPECHATTVSAAPDGRLRWRFYLPYRPPYHWAAFLDFIRQRAIFGVERVEGETYRRLVRTPEGVAHVVASNDPRKRAIILDLRAVSNALPALLEAAAQYFDVYADPLRIGAHFGGSAELHPLQERSPGIRVPGAWCGFELAVRAIVGQQVSVQAATTTTAQIVRRFGELVPEEDGLTNLFPQPAVLADAAVAAFPMPARRAQAIVDLARATTDGTLNFDAATLPAGGLIQQMQAISGIGPWTANYVAMRVCKDPDAFPDGDLGLLHALGLDGGNGKKLLKERSAHWRPFRAYAAFLLWNSLSMGREQ